jgi:hypothetical protein
MEMPIESYHKYKYVMVLLDDFSSAAWNFLLRKKLDAFPAFRQWLATISKHQRRLNILHSDRGGELTSAEFEAFLKSKGIIHQKSAPHEHQQNGQAEHINRTLMDKAEAMRHNASLPMMWWEFSIATAVHIYNRTPLQRTNGKCPLENLTLEKPDVSYFHVFGCEAWVYIPQEVHADKLSPKSEVMTFVGYNINSKAYKFMTKENKLVVSSQATFNELKFPRAKKELDIATRDQRSLNHPESGVDNQGLDQLLDLSRELQKPEQIDRICHLKGTYKEGETSKEKQQPSFSPTMSNQEIPSFEQTHEEPVPHMSEKAKRKRKQVDEEYLDPGVELGPDVEIEETPYQKAWHEFKERVDRVNAERDVKSPSLVSLEMISDDSLFNSRASSPVPEPFQRSSEYLRDENRIRRQNMDGPERRRDFFKQRNENQSGLLDNEDREDYPRRSECGKIPRFLRDNAYGDKTPVQIQTEIDRQKDCVRDLMEEVRTKHMDVIWICTSF